MAFGGCAPQPDVIPPEEPPAPVVVEPEPEPEPPPPPTYPLTGLVAPDDELSTHLRTISVKIENTPEAKPQLGITRADVVYETVTEGGITRFNCLFQSDLPDEVGPVRSARDSDMSIVPEYNALFFFSGTNSLVWARLGTTSINEMNHSSAPALYHRVNYKAAPHNLFLDVTGIYETAQDMGYSAGDPYPHALLFGDYDMSAMGDAYDAVSIFVPYSGGIFDVTWDYDNAEGKYLRSIQGNPQVDAAEGSPQVAADNVVLLVVPYVASPPVPNKGQTWNMDFTGSGQAVIFRDGKRIDCFWTTDGDRPPLFFDAAGNSIPLKPGKTWFQVPPSPDKMVVTTGHEEADAAAAAAAESAAQADDDAYLAADAADTD
jgi:hypothetical protein